MKLARLALVGGFGLIALGCAGERSDEVPADTAAMVSEGPTVMTFEVREAARGLLAIATFRPADAQRVALMRFPNGTITEAVIDRSGTDLIYTYTIRDNSTGETHTVKVNARTGTVVDSLPR